MSSSLGIPLPVCIPVKDARSLLLANISKNSGFIIDNSSKCFLVLIVLVTIVVV